MSARVLWLMKGLGLGGAERLVSLMAPKLDRSRFELEVAYLLPWKDAFVGGLESSGVATVCLGATSTLDARWAFRLRSLLRARRYDIIHTHSPVPAAAARLLAGRRQTLVHTEHNVWERYRRGTYLVNAVTYGRNAAVIAVSDGVAQSIVVPRWVPRGTPPPVETLHHGVDIARIPSGFQARRRARELLAIPMTAPVIGTVANFTPKKDHAGLLLAVEQLRHDFNDLIVLLVGSGPLEPTLRAQVAHRGLEQHVRFLGSRDDVPELLAALDVFVLGSQYEGLPISLLEAMAAGVPCVATRVGGVPEAVSDGIEGDLVAPGDPRALAEAIGGQLRDPDRRRRLGRAGIRRVREHFSIERATKRVEEIYGQRLAAVGA